ncbi:MAG TPA: DUF4215 domain-containing protein [Kofleriaceae bacterium]|nr:DUF4215 domain-containing protein [Kofleriaceae bacterium]
MLSRTRVAAAWLAIVVGASSAHAVVSSPTSRARQSHDRGLEALPAAGLPRPVRDHVEIGWQLVPGVRQAAWQRLHAAAPGLDQVGWDAATAVPSRIFGRGVDVPNSVADGAVALAAARAFLAEHVDLLAPGSTPADFVLAANDLDDGIRTVAFFQQHGGLPVVGGQVSFRFKHDRLFVIGSEALPDVAVAGPIFHAGAIDVSTRAYLDTVADLGLDAAKTTAAAPGDAAILPLVGERGVMAYRVVVPVAVDGGSAGAWQVWADPATGEAVARQSTTRFAAGVVAFDAVARWTGRPRQTVGAPLLDVNLADGPSQTSADGGLTWTGSAPLAVTATVHGGQVDVQNQDGDEATTTLTLAPDQTAVWRPGDDRELDAQVSSYINAGIVKRYAHTFAPNLAFLDEQLAVRVNIDDECNAFSDGTTINFFRASDQCENTGTIADVVFHEFGHTVHAHSIIPGAGFFDGAFSEGLSDYLAITITGDPGMGRGFFKDDTPLRDLDPPNSEAVWPRDIGEVHATGMIFAGAMWDLRKALVADLGHDDGVTLANRLYYAAVRRAPSIPATLIEILAADDDDGDLDDGTPHECAIRAAFARHGLRTTAGIIEAEGAIAESTTETMFQPELTLVGLDEHCGDVVRSVALDWKPRGANDSPRAGTADAHQEDGHWTAAMPLPDDGDVALYHFRIGFTDGSQMTFPDNRADPWYQVYRGDVVPLYCTDFEDDPFAAGWVAGGPPGVWQWGEPGGSRGVGDPGVAFSGTHVLGTGLSNGDGAYPPRASTWIDSPAVDVGQWSDVRLHYRRWLNVEDGFFDQASIKVNDEVAWQNLSSRGDGNKTTHHEDKAWVFSDVALSPRIRGHSVTVRWQIDSDEGFQLGGWNLDDVCVVANVNSVCGDGRLSGAEQCDLGDGNRDVADTCRTTCRVPVCGDGIKDSVEACDDGNSDNLDGCTDHCTVYDPMVDEPGGCCSTGGGGGAGTAVLAPLVLGGLLLRPSSRRRRRVR